MCFILYHVLTIHQPFEKVVGILVVRDAPMGKEGHVGTDCLQKRVLALHKLKGSSHLL